ncbi:protein CHROMATIN REMODELING 5 isoform X2 [Selaginella moellendorffii]|uniref:protein CHROMATIN REMODELING 5 isoform X2 n=1 Tax=Selaginella moellendorffii TaxID=88036 RepID=UPI000D1C6A95|nr:protein CHROMATIN REMODELING 5 isoform X2 [Selaginella moellendorffii]|eukprot:XP_024529944.1 protein CHROMATIN REMODELING 5 isoform X2 [Selaginella moellendorffii]
MMSEYEEADESNENEDSFVGQQEHFSSRPRKSRYEPSDGDDASQSDHGDPEYKEDSGDENYEDGGYENGAASFRYSTVESRDFQLEPEESEEYVMEEEEEDDNGGDDPQDADFDPVSPENNFSQQEEDDDDDYNASAEEQEEAASTGGFDVSSDEELVRPANPRKRPAIKIAQPRFGSNNQKRHRIVQKKDYPSDEEDSSDGEDQRNHRKVVVASSIRPVVIAPSQRAPADFSSRETRSRRSIPRKSYVEEESEEDEEDQKAKKKVSPDEIEEEDSDKIERVVWHQPKGIAEAEMLEGRKAEPFILDTDPHADLDWEEQEFYIKWKGQSYLHCQWQGLADLHQLSGYKKVVNYMKKVEEDRQKRRNLSGEEAEVHDLSKEMELDLLKQYTQVERVFAERIGTVDGEEFQEYLVKWKGLSYAESTWEKDIDLAFAQDFIDEYKERESASNFQGKSVDFQRKRVILRKLEEQPEWLKGGKLRDYQLEGLNFLVNGWRMNTNVILADEMGLGKTVQSLSMLGYLQYNLEILGPFLVVVPLSTIANWAKEFRKWLPNMNVLVYVGNVASREMCQKYEFFTASGRAKFNTLITTYELVLKDKDVLSQFKWDFLMVDEAHRLKNNEAALYTELMKFSAKNKVLVTGTPLQNNVEELWALLHFLDPIKFRNKDDYKNLVSFNEAELARLHAELRPHLLRRVIKDVEKSLPPKIERILRVEMSPLQKQYYKWILERNFSDLNKGVRGNQVSLLNIVVELKKCCNHPFLFESADHGYGANATMTDNSRVQRVVLSSGKLVLLDKLLVRLKETGHRVLIFSQMVKMLDILADYLRLRGFQFQRLDGSTKHHLRQQAMEHFNAPGSEDFCFLLSTRAGGLGINLATADTVIIFDSDWNPQNDLQAMSRAHRIGQEFVVNIYRFVTCRSVEEDILERAKKKMVLDHLVIQKLNAQGRLEMKETKKATTMFDKNELAAILKFGAEELFKEEKKSEEEAKSKLENMDIDEILERAEKVSGDTEQPGGELLGAFKVANFSQGEDDAAFWSRLIPAETAKEAPDLGPRAARKIRTYAEDLPADRYSKRRKNAEEVGRKRSTRLSRAPEPPPRVDGASAHVYEWEGTTISKRDANAFVKGVKKFGDKSRIDMIVVNTGSAIENASEDSQLDLMDALLDGCTEAVDNSHNPKAAILDFFGVTVKAQEVLTRVKELTLLGKRIRRYQDPVSQFRLRSHSKNPSSMWSRWSQVDDARLLLGVYYHGYGNWEKIRTDERLLLGKKMAPGGATAGETSLPRATHLDARVNTLLRKETELDKGSNGETSKSRSKRNQESSSKLRQGKDRASNSSRPSGTRKSARNINRENAAIAAAAREEAEDKEEGEISDDESTQRRPKGVTDEKERDQRWHNWCEGVMKGEVRTLKRLQNLKSAHSESNEKVVVRVKKYLQKLGQKIDSILDDNKGEKCNPQKMAMRLWNYVARFSDLSGPDLSDLYHKLKRQPEAAAPSAASVENNNENNGTSREKHEPLTYKRRHGRKDNAESSKRRRKGGDEEETGARNSSADKAHYFYGKGTSRKDHLDRAGEED